MEFTVVALGTEQLPITSWRCFQGARFRAVGPLQVGMQLMALPIPIL